MQHMDGQIINPASQERPALQAARAAPFSVEQIAREILSRVGEGVFFVDRSFNIRDYFSDALKEILCIDEIMGKNFISLLENRVPEEVILNAEEYLHILFREDLDQDEIRELNPLSETEFFYEDGWGMWTSSKYLSFKFGRIIRDGKIEVLIATIKDISESVRLRDKLAKIEKHTQKQMEWLVNILHVEPALLQDFFAGVEKELDNVDKALKNSRGTNRYLAILENVYRSLYIIKGNASLLDLKFFSNKASQFLEKIVETKSKQEISGNDFVPIVVELGELRKTLGEVQTIFKRISHFHNHFRAKRSYESELLVNSLKNLIENLSQQLGKEVAFDYKDFDALAIPYAYRQMVRDILFLLIRNTILYGIESSEERKSANKTAEANIKISSYINDRFLGLVLRHDGRIERIERMLQEMMSRDGLSGPDNQKWQGFQVTQLLFMPNISFKDEKEINENNAMDIEVLKQKVKEKGGRLKITFTSEEFCEFTVLLPLKNKG